MTLYVLPSKLSCNTRAAANIQTAAAFLSSLNGQLPAINGHTAPMKTAPKGRHYENDRYLLCHFGFNTCSIFLIGTFIHLVNYI